MSNYWHGWRCVRCGSNIPAVFVHGHYQCPTCKSVTDDCCQGEVCQPREEKNDTETKMVDIP